MTKENTARNVRIKAERHEKRMTRQGERSRDMLTPRGTRRNLRRKPLQVAYKRRTELAASHKAAGVSA